jgi:hypothetical protein
VLERLERRGPDDVTWFGRLADHDDAGVDVVLVSKAGSVAGTLFLPGHTLALRTQPAGGAEVLAELPTATRHEHALVPPPGAADDARPPADEATHASGLVTIDVMIVYGQAALNANGANLGAKIQAAVDLANVAMTNSLTDVRFRLVHAEKVADAELTDLETLTASAAVAQLRDRWGADLVAGWAVYNDYCGVGWLNMGRSRPEYGYTAVDLSCVSALTPAHEWGHNLGAHHDRANGGPAAFPYSYGLVSVAGDWRTVMAYNSASCPGGSCQQVPYFSNPDVAYRGLATGVPASEDNARTIRAIAPIVAAYRPEAGVPRTPPSAPTTVAAAPGDRSAAVSWAPPSDTGGSPVTGYRVTALPGGATCAWWSGPLSCVVTGLTNGTPHTFTVTATNEVGTGPPSGPSVAVTPPGPTGRAFLPMAPVRVLDSRPSGPALGGHTTPWGPGVTRTAVVAGIAGIPADAEAVAMNVTVTGTTAGSYLTVFPTGVPRPLASSLNWTPGQTVANAVTAAVGSDGTVSLFNAVGRADVVIDVVGYFRGPTGAGLVPLAPARVLDSRPDGPAVGGYAAPWGPGTSRAVTVAGVGGVPLDAEAVVLNVTVTTTTAGSYLTVSPGGAARPLASSLNWEPGQTVANAVTARVGDAGTLEVFNIAGTADVVIDVVGYYRTDLGGLFHAQSPVRVQDSRPWGPAVGSYTSPWAAGGLRSVRVTGVGGVPADAVAVSLNVTVTGTTGNSFLTVFPAGVARPLASSLNWGPGQTRANAVTAMVGPTGAVALYNDQGQADVVIDVVGWYR